MTAIISHWFPKFQPRFSQIQPPQNHYIHFFFYHYIHSNKDNTLSLGLKPFNDDHPQPGFYNITLRNLEFSNKMPKVYYKETEQMGIQPIPLPTKKSLVSLQPKYSKQVFI